MVASEALTGGPNKSMWTEDPAFLKIFCDEAYAQGVNRFMLHHWTHQPFDDKYQPGRTMYAWGTHFGRHQTWFEPGKAFFAYLGRCQTLLQQGERVMDYLCMDQLDGEADMIAKDVFLQSDIKVKDGHIVLPSGRSYAFMVFPRDGEMLPEVAEKIKTLVAEGATVVSTRPKKSPSLKDYPQCEETLRRLGDEVWGSGTENRYKKGFVFSKIEDAKAKLNLKPDYTIEKASADPAKIMVLHRRKIRCGYLLHCQPVGEGAKHLPFFQDLRQAARIVAGGRRNHNRCAGVARARGAHLRRYSVEGHTDGLCRVPKGGRESGTYLGGQRARRQCRRCHETLRRARIALRDGDHGRSRILDRQKTHGGTPSGAGG